MTTTLKYTLTINEFGPHLSRPGHAGQGFDAGENASEMRLAMNDLADHLYEQWAAIVKQAKARLEYLRGEIEAERISTGEIAELQDLTAFIEPGDTLLLEWAGVPEEN